ncbi:acylphosphatase [Auritidibacter ignavus]|uniref:acylphosphatase n=1 Tax=Auritidibacter ignavus TaxID=678932 RepID=UPI0024B8785E|nr:acylphosphatase [Auritidibacter ignavus]WHS35886.1 acylphosphatase [Auritidibacter ignavus]
MADSLSTGRFVRITGTVQGVNFRNSAKQQADQLGLVGWVANTEDGAVELVVGGSSPEVDSLLAWCHTGPERAEVTEVQDREASNRELAELPESGFHVRR